MSKTRLRAMTGREWAVVADLIHVSTNYWYRANGRPPIFPGDPLHTQLFCQVYETLDPGCCVVAEDQQTGRIAASCFYHPRPTHVSLGIMNVHPSYFGHGLARRLLRFIIDFADEAALPLRLVSSAVNLDSFSLYNRAGLIPRTLYQDMILEVPTEGMVQDHPLRDRVRPATLDDAEMIAAFETLQTGISREKDYRYFLKNEAGIWHTSLIEGEQGIHGFLVSIAHPASNMLGPGVMRDSQTAAALILNELDYRQGRTPVWLVPCDQPELVQQMYAWGARNCELHIAQCRGKWQPPKGIVLPTFMPETG